MSFFLEASEDKNNIILFSAFSSGGEKAGEEAEKYKTYLSTLGGTYFRELATKNGNKYPAWIFDVSKRPEIENFIEENDDSGSVQSMPDFEAILDEIFRRLDSLEQKMEELQGYKKD